MRTPLILIAALGLALPALAQTPAPSQGTRTPTGSSNPAVGNAGNAPADTTTGTVNIINATALEKGSNSFTEGQAKSRFEAAGLSKLTDLNKDGDGIWRGTGTRNGKAVKVGLDYKGNISAE